jgi:hypothetical protein
MAIQFDLNYGLQRFDLADRPNHDVPVPSGGIVPFIQRQTAHHGLSVAK